jgi:hypothetical protein
MTALGPYDVICGRDKVAFNNVGNRRFRITVSLFLPRYINSSMRKEKTNTIKEIIDLVHANNGRFVNWDEATSQWQQLDHQECCKKVGHALRDMALARRKEIMIATKSNKSRKTKVEAPKSAEGMVTAMNDEAEALHTISMSLSPATSMDMPKATGDIFRRVSYTASEAQQVNLGLLDYHEDLECIFGGDINPVACPELANPDASTLDHLDVAFEENIALRLFDPSGRLDRIWEV